MADPNPPLLEKSILHCLQHRQRPWRRLHRERGLARGQAGRRADKALNRIETESNLLNDLIGQVLTLTSLEGGMEDGPRRLVDLHRLVREVAADAAFEAQGSDRKVRVVECAPCAIPAREGLMRRAVENVVRNAITYTSPGSQVEISLRSAVVHGGAFAEISVRDHGPGVDEEELPRIFRPFYRVSDARERQTGGSGLGLAITERAIGLHHGTVWAANAPGGGLQVVILLPLGPAGPGRTQTD